MCFVLGFIDILKTSFLVQVPFHMLLPITAYVTSFEMTSRGISYKGSLEIKRGSYQKYEEASVITSSCCMAEFYIYCLRQCFSTCLMSRPTFAPISKSHKKWSYWIVESAPTRPHVCSTWSPHLPWVCGTPNSNPGLKMGAFLGWNATVIHFCLS